ncbi:hypothetical protein [Cohnella sp. GbtcB17]|uniref:glycan biosynthesis hexose transferase WsfD n=1 Tax=Cohnella sp. GbtcB17 TaxID=2824762 RepID=UPI001C311953|nr:hypothetical protein [Cohnella sp. GbtcB17]
MNDEASRKRVDSRIIAAWIALGTAAAIIVYLLFVPPVIGVADNGDFNRVMGAAGIAYADAQESYADRYFGYAHQFYHYGGFTSGGYVSTHVLLVAIAGGIGRIIDSQTFDIRVLGFCYMVLMLAALWLLVRYAPRMRGKYLTGAAAALVAAIGIVIFCDVGYTAYYQSFFGEPYALVATMLALGAAVAIASRVDPNLQSAKKPNDEPQQTVRPPSAWLLALFVGAGVALATSKIQNAPIGFLLALLAWRMVSLRPDKGWRLRARVGAGILALSAVLMMALAPDQLRHINLYQSIFFGALKDTPDLKRDMRELGIPDKYAGLAGTNYFQKDTIVPQSDPTLRKEVLDRLSHRDIALYYARHPERFVSKLEKAAENGTSVRPYYLGNYSQSAGRERSELSYAFSAWSEWKHRHMPNTLAWFAACYVVYYALLAAWWLRSRSAGRPGARLLAETLAVIGASGAMAVTVSLMGDGEADLGKHLFMFNVCFDIMAASALAAAVYGLLWGIGALAAKSGNRRHSTIIVQPGKVSGYNREE